MPRIEFRVSEVLGQVISCNFDDLICIPHDGGPEGRWAKHTYGHSIAVAFSLSNYIIVQRARKAQDP